MRNLFVRFSSLLLILSVFVFSLFSVCSCAKKEPPYSLMGEFCAEFGIEDTVFSPAVPEGKDGYTPKDFFENVFGESRDSVLDYAVVFLSSLDSVGECVLFLCYSEYDALMACEILQRRVDLIKAMGTSMDVSYAADAIVFKNGKYVVMCALSDNAKAEKIWRKIL